FGTLPNQALAGRLDEDAVELSGADVALAVDTPELDPVLGVLLRHLVQVDDAVERHQVAGLRKAGHLTRAGQARELGRIARLDAGREDAVQVAGALVLH